MTEAGSFVLDASVALAWAFEDEWDGYATDVLDSLAGTDAVVPSIWPLEITNGLLVAVRRGRLNRAEAGRFLALVRKLPLTMQHETADRLLFEVYSLASERNLSSYDASYLDLAMRRGLPLATLDTALRQAASSCGVPLFKTKGSDPDT